jgi:hypothetical protein
LAGRSRTTFRKREKELARLEKRKEKAERREQRKLDKQTQGPDDGVASAEDLEDLGLDDDEDLAADEPSRADL